MQVNSYLRWPGMLLALILRERTQETYARLVSHAICSVEMGCLKRIAYLDSIGDVGRADLCRVLNLLL